MKHSRSLPTFSRPMSSSEELTVLRKKVQALKSIPSEARAVLAKAGICTTDGRLTKAFGGDA